MLASVGCERKTVVIEVPPPTPMAEPVAKTKTLETSRLAGAIDAYETRPGAENSADVKKAFAKLDGEIAELEAYVAKHEGTERAEAAAKLKNMQEYRAAETARFTAVQAKSALSAPASSPVDDRSGAEKAGDAARKAGHEIEDAAKKTGDAIKDAVRR